MNLLGFLREHRWVNYRHLASPPLTGGHPSLLEGKPSMSTAEKVF